MNQGLLALGIWGFVGSAAYGNDVPVPAAVTIEQAQARQFGIFFGGMATQYDLCVKKGFLAKGAQSAETTAKSILEKMRQFNQSPDESAFAQNGWDFMKQEVAKHESDYTQEKCAGVAKEWAKMLSRVPPE